MKFTTPIPSCSNENFCFHVGDYSFGFQAQEQDEELWSGSVTYKYRVEDPRLGRFFSVDPLHSKYPFVSPYAFSENRVISAKELEGLEAWETTSHWDESYIAGYRATVNYTLHVAQASGIRFTCEDLAIYVLIKFASQNGLPVVIQNGTGFYFNEDITFETTDEFMNQIQITSGARDLLLATIPTDPCNMEAGDVILLDLDNDGVVNHTQVVDSQDDTETTICQGNFLPTWNIIGGARGEDPKEDDYLGAPIQTASYDNTTGNYTRDGETTNSLLFENGTKPREWDFYGFNELGEFCDYFQYNAITTVPGDKTSCHGE